MGSWLDRLVSEPVAVGGEAVTTDGDTITPIS
jgi:hypothetical protein